MQNSQINSFVSFKIVPFRSKHTSSASVTVQSNSGDHSHFNALSSLVEFLLSLPCFDMSSHSDEFVSFYINKSQRESHTFISEEYEWNWTCPVLCFWPNNDEQEVPCKLRRCRVEATNLMRFHATVVFFAESHHVIALKLKYIVPLSNCLAWWSIFVM